MQKVKREHKAMLSAFGGGSVALPVIVAVCATAGDLSMSAVATIIFTKRRLVMMPDMIRWQNLLAQYRRSKRKSNNCLA
jgi:hypothetical protein